MPKKKPTPKKASSTNNGLPAKKAQKNHSASPTNSTNKAKQPAQNKFANQAPVNLEPPVASYQNQTPAVGQFFIFGICVILFLPTLIAPLWTIYGYSPDLHMAWIIQFGMSVLLAWYFFAHVKRPFFGIIINPVFIATISFYLWALLSLIWAHNKFESLISLLDWGAGILTLTLILQTVRKPEHIRQLVIAMFATGVLLSILGIFQYLFDVTWIQQHAKPAATFNNKNMAAQYTLMTIGLGLGLFWTSKNAIETWIYAISTAFIVLFVHYTITRGANMATLGIFLFMAVFILSDRFFNKRKGPMNKERWQAATVGILLFLILGMFTSEGFQGLAPYTMHVEEAGHVLSNELDPNTRERGTRMDMWQNSTAMIRNNFFTGVGMGNWMVHYPLYQTAVSIDREMSEAIQHINAHNDYVEIFSDLGLIGFLLLLSVFVAAIYCALRNFYTNLDNTNRYLLLGVLLAATGISINAIGSFPFKQPAPIMLICAFLGIIANEYARWKNTKVIKVRSRPYAIILGFIGLFLSTSIFALHYQWNLSEIQFRLATIASHQGKFHRMMLHGKKSHEALPLRDRMLNFVGMGHLRTGNPVEAAKYLELVKKSYPHRNNTLQNLGYIYLELAERARKSNDIPVYNQNLQKAADNFKHLSEIRTDNHRSMRNLGITYYRQAASQRGKQRADTLILASKTILQSIERDPNIPDKQNLINLSNNLKAEADKITQQLNSAGTQ